jgi:predicted acyltransferase
MENTPSTRVQSLDIMRGLIMLLLAAESCQLYTSLEKMAPGNLLVQQFFHHPWHGLRFWDLVQPAFMLMAGAALYLSYSKNLQRGINWTTNLGKISGRCLKLLLCGVALHCVYAGELVWELWNVLSQLAVTIMLAYLIINLSAVKQLFISFTLLLITELLYRYSAVPGFDQAFVDGHNFGNYMDTLLMGKINNDGWVAINAIPTAAHTIWGVLAGKLLMSSKPLKVKLLNLFIAGSIGLFLGFLLDGLNITPIIKRISTSSFVLVSGGWILLLLLGIYWLTDVKQYSRYGWIFTVIGMNAIFIYLFFETVGMQWLNECIYIFIGAPAAALGMSLSLAAILNALVTLFIEWYLCYWLYKKSIFFKL